MHKLVELHDLVYGCYLSNFYTTLLALHFIIRAAYKNVARGGKPRFFQV